MQVKRNSYVLILCRNCSMNQENSWLSCCEDWLSQCSFLYELTMFVYVALPPVLSLQERLETKTGPRAPDYDCISGHFVNTPVITSKTANSVKLYQILFCSTQVPFSSEPGILVYLGSQEPG
jgi:hypothetical protein